MRVTVEYDGTVSEPEIIIKAANPGPEIDALVKMLTESDCVAIPAYSGKDVVFVMPEDIVRAYSDDDRVYIRSLDKTYTVKMRLYELEAVLAPFGFVRISSSELVNRRFIEHLNFSLSGTIGITLKGGSISYVSRRFVKQFKNYMGL